MSRYRHSALVLSLMLLTGCASQPTPRTPAVAENLDERADYPIDIFDPWESWNRRIYTFNAKFDRYLFIPVVEGYAAVMPDPAERGVANFFSNLGEISHSVNGALQLKPDVALTGLGRLALNSTVGILGLWDPASRLGLKQKPEDFGQTLAYWGMAPGPYLILPILGPASVRDSLGLVGDYSLNRAIDPLNLDHHSRRALIVNSLSAINARHNIKFRYLQGGSPFEYEALRYLYTKKRELDGLK